MLYISPDVRQADDTYRELTKLIAPADVAIWTGAHDAPSTLEEIRSRFDGFEPTAPRFKKADVEGFRVAIISHNWYLSTKGVHGALSYEGHPRTLHLIDERLSEVKLSDLGLADVIEARDTIISQRGDKDPLARALTALAVYMDHIWETERVIPGAAFKAIGGVQPTPSNELEWFTSDDAATEARRAFNDKTVADAIAFGRSLVTGHAFMARYQQATKGGRFISYKLDLPRIAGSVLLDASSDIDGVKALTPWRVNVSPPKVSFANLSIKHLPFPIVDPVGLKKTVKEITASAKLSIAYAEWIERTIIAETEPGEMIVAVTHRDVG